MDMNSYNYPMFTLRRNHKLNINSTQYDKKYIGEEGNDCQNVYDVQNITEELFVGTGDPVSKKQLDHEVENANGFAAISKLFQLFFSQFLITILQ